MTTAVVFLVFNRPALTRQVFERIRAARPPQLFVVADGPRPDRLDEAEKCAEVRRLIEEGVDWPCEVVRDYSDVNLGCGRRVASGITNVFKRVDEAIILEDDCLPDSTFFLFCEELLVRYRDEPKVAQIAGCSFQPANDQLNGASYYFSRYPHCWGWATWRRAWQYYDHEMTAWTSSSRNWFWDLFEHKAERRWWAFNFGNTANGVTDSWAFRWTVSVWSHRWLGVLPYKNLVSNIGVGPDATHTKASCDAMGVPNQSMVFPMTHPTKIERDTVADDYSSMRRFQMKSLGERALGRLKRLLKL